MSPGAEIFRFIFDLMKIISIIIAGLVILFVVTAVISGVYGESVFACPDRRVCFTDEQAISFTKKYIDSHSYFPEAMSSKDYSSRSKADGVSRYGWFVSRKAPTNFIQAEEITIEFVGREGGASAKCSMLACGVMLGCEY